MPKLRQYPNRKECYVLTSVCGVLVSFQLTSHGEARLKDVGIVLEENFPRGLLLDLCRAGDAFARSSDAGEWISDSLNEVELDFVQDSDPETLFPACDDCASLDDLHLSLLREQGTLAGKLQCPLCRKTLQPLDTCIPVRLLTLTLFERLFEIKHVVKRYEGVDRLENLFRSVFESRWEELRKRKRHAESGSGGAPTVWSSQDISVIYSAEEREPTIEQKKLSFAQKATAMFENLQATGRSHLTLFDEKWENLKNSVPAAGISTPDAARQAFVNALLVIQNKDLLQWTASMTEGAATAYDKAMDGIGSVCRVQGNEHRLFDGGHTLWGSWQASAKAATEQGHNDYERFLGWVEAYVKDFTTPMGMPVVTWEKATFDQWVDSLAGVLPGVDRRFLYDLVSFDVMEVCASGMGAVAVVYALKAEDQQKLAENLGMMGVSAITAANPILGLVTIASAGYAYRQNQQIDFLAAAKGGSVAGISAAMFACLGFPVLIEFVIVLALSSLLKKHVVDNAQLARWIDQKVRETLKNYAQANLDFQRFLPGLRTT